MGSAYQSLTHAESSISSLLQIGVLFSGLVSGMTRHALNKASDMFAAVTMATFGSGNENMAIVCRSGVVEICEYAGA